MTTEIDWKPIYGIRFALIEADETQKDLAQRLGWSEARLSKILSDDQKLLVDDLTEIARAQGKEYDWYLRPNFAKGVWRGWEQLAIPA